MKGELKLRPKSNTTKHFDFFSAIPQNLTLLAKVKHQTCLSVQSWNCYKNRYAKLPTEDEKLSDKTLAKCHSRKVLSKLARALRECDSGFFVLSVHTELNAIMYKSDLLSPSRSVLTNLLNYLRIGTYYFS